MKKLLLGFVFTLLTVSAFAQLSDSEREFAIDYLDATHQNIANMIAELPEESFNYKPEDGGWSVSNALEHILLTETAFFQMVQGTLQNPEAKTEKDLSGMDAVHIGRLANRGTKVKTAAPLEPSGKWDSKEAMLEELDASRTKLIDYLKSTNKDLRGHTTTIPVGEVDTYQIFLLIAAHSQRHTFQMREVLTEMEAI